MATLRIFDEIEQFISYNEIELKKQYLIFRQLLSILQEVSEGKIGAFKLFNVIEKDTSKFICLQTKSYLIIIPLKTEVNISAYQLLKSTLQASIVSGVEILGERTLVLRIVEDLNVKFNVIKDRLLYECKETNEIQPCQGSLQIPLWENIEEITRMELNYHKEEYGDKSNCDFAGTKQLVQEKMKKQSILLWKNKNEIVSLINANFEADFFYIYHIYTKPIERKKGFGTNLLHTVTSKIINSEKIKVGLVSQRHDSNANKIFKKIGFVPIDEMLDIEIL